jgi:hypothetical protein
MSEQTSGSSARALPGALMAVTYALGAVGFFLGGLLGSPALAWVCVLAVAGPTVIGAVRHIVLWRADADRLGFATPDPSWMWEVGAANAAIAVAALLVGLLDWGVGAQVAVIVVMAVYMAGATAVHTWSHRSGAATRHRNPVVAIGGSLVYALALLGFAVWGAVSAGLPPF